MATEKTDVVIVGVGAAGGILAAELSKAGMKVIGLERGPRLKTADFDPHDELRYFQRQELRPDPKRQPVTWRPNAGVRAKPLSSMSYGNQAGGGTVHYGAVSWRLHEDDFRARSRTIERYGAAAIPENLSLIDWPLSYGELEPYYDRAEYELGVSGKAGNLQGNKIDGGNVFEAPRRRDYPLPPLRPDQSEIIFEEATRKLGYHPFSTPRAIISEPYNNRPGCTYCGFCQAFGCHVGAKSSILVTKLPEADASGNFKLITGAMCYRVNSDNSGKVTGVSYYGPDRSDNTIEADLVILTPFIYDNTRLLLLSKTARFPDGLANSSGQVGKHIMTHIRSRVIVAFDDRFVNIYMGPSAQKRSIDDFNADNFDHKDLGFIRGAQISIGPTALEGGPDRRRHHAAAARRAALGRRLSRLLGQILCTARRHRGADRRPAVSESNNRSRPGRARCLGLAGTAHDLRLAPPQRAGAPRVHRQENGRDGPRHRRAAGVAHGGKPRRAGRPSRGWYPHGQRSEDLGGEQVRAELGYSQSVRDRQLDVSVAVELQPDPDHRGARLHERGCDRQPLQEKSGSAAVSAQFVIASEAKQSRGRAHRLWIASSLRSSQ